MKKVLLLIFLVFGFKNISVSSKEPMYEECVICYINPNGKHNPHKIPMRDKTISLRVYGNSIYVESGISFQQLVKLEFYSTDGTLIYKEQGYFVNGDIVEIAPNIIGETSKISIILSAKEYIGIL